MSETWRIVLADGTVVPLVISGGPGDGGWWVAHVEGHGIDFGTGDTIGAAVVHCAAAMDYDVREILAPGESTRAEALAAAEREREAARANRDTAKRRARVLVRHLGAERSAAARAVAAARAEGVAEGMEAAARVADGAAAALRRERMDHHVDCVAFRSGGACPECDSYGERAEALDDAATAIRAAAKGGV